MWWFCEQRTPCFKKLKHKNDFFQSDEVSEISLDEIDTSNILNRRTRGVKVDWKKILEEEKVKGSLDSSEENDEDNEIEYHVEESEELNDEDDTMDMSRDPSSDSAVPMEDWNRSNNTYCPTFFC